MKNFRIEMLIGPTYYAKFSCGVAKKRSYCNPKIKFNVRQKSAEIVNETNSFRLFFFLEKPKNMCNIFINNNLFNSYVFEFWKEYGRNEAQFSV